MNPDTSLDAIGGCGAMGGSRRNPGMEGDRSCDVLVTVPCGCVSDRIEAIEHPVEPYADFAETHRGRTGDGAAPPSGALSDMNGALRDG